MLWQLLFGNPPQIILCFYIYTVVYNLLRATRQIKDNLVLMVS